METKKEEKRQDQRKERNEIQLGVIKIFNEANRVERDGEIVKRKNGCENNLRDTIRLAVFSRTWNIQSTRLLI